MRALVLAALCGISLSTIGAASAQDRIVIRVKPRSWLDAGPVVPVGSMQNYMNDTGGIPDTSRFGARNGSTLLPDRFAAGRGFVFETPHFRGLD
ncbi:MAG TPA: hypothetical protein PKW21_14825 [Rhabdaerophilum sp.]|nr:hypothetical protein [Rhabdaerophilum sp.]